ncbi:MAG TPA: hypothetical protein PLO95_00370 [Spirochaetota bacterium]|nr:hypothetical protein [Spirochaetota bacterium]
MILEKLYIYVKKIFLVLFLYKIILLFLYGIGGFQNFSQNTLTMILKMIIFTDSVLFMFALANICASIRLYEIITKRVLMIIFSVFNILFSIITILLFSIVVVFTR